MYFCLTTIIKNEHKFLDEWIQYHINLGINKIFIFEDINSKSHKDICDKYDKHVSLNNIFDILNNKDKQRAKYLKLTKKGYVHPLYIKKGLSYLKGYSNLYDWCFVIDNDEFITLENNDLNNTLLLYKDYDAFILSWKCYGANGLINKPDYSKQGIINTYITEAKGYIPAINPTVLTKTCFNLKKYRKEYYWTNHQPSDTCKFCRTNYSNNRNLKIYNNIYIKHYITKSWEEYFWKIKTRGYFIGKIKTFEFFFNVNPDMNIYKEQLINEAKNISNSSI